MNRTFSAAHVRNLSVARKRQLQKRRQTICKGHKFKDGLCVTCEKTRYQRYKHHSKAFYFRTVLAACKGRAKKLGVPFNITQADLIAAWPSDGRCPVLGIRLRRNFGGKWKWNSPSVDRVRPKRGYTVGNIAIVSNWVNRLKGNETDPLVFRKLAEWLEKVMGSRDSARKVVLHHQYTQRRLDSNVIK